MKSILIIKTVLVFLFIIFALTPTKQVVYIDTVNSNPEKIDSLQKAIKIKLDSLKCDKDNYDKKVKILERVIKTKT